MEATDEYVDISAVCRICIARRGTVDLFAAHEGLLLGYSLAERIMSFACVELVANDGLPTKVCVTCLTQIDQAFNLKVQCEHADSTLRQIQSEENDSTSPSVTPMEDVNGKDDNEVRELSSKLGIDASNLVKKEECRLTPTLEECSDDIAALISNDHFIIERSELKHLSHQESRLKDIPDNNTDVKNVANTLSIREVGSQASVFKRKQRKSFSVYCTECGKQFRSNKLLEIHCVSHTGHKSFLCKHCGKRFSRYSSMRDHEKRHNGPHFLCSDCGKLIKRKRGHLCVAMRDKSKKSYSCDVCEKKFISQGTLTTHKKRHTTTARFPCSECNKSLFSRQELERHVRVHFGVRPFKCSEENCALTFYSQGELNRHLRYHNGVRKFSCDLCGQKFFESGHLVNHLRKHSGERPYCCKECPKTFTTGYKLSRHSTIHQRSSNSTPQEGNDYEESKYISNDEKLDDQQSYHTVAQITLESDSEAV